MRWRAGVLGAVLLCGACADDGGGAGTADVGVSAPMDGGSSGMDGGHDAGMDTGPAEDRVMPAVDLGSTPPDLPMALDAAAEDTPGMARDDGITDDRGGLLDVVSLDARPDVAVDVPFRCTDNASCTGNASGEVCDPATGRCVRCRPEDDPCPMGQYCVPGMHQCAQGCRDDASCRSVGPATPVCDLTVRRCVSCLRDEHCAAGTLCVGQRCVPGCNPARPCPSAQQCCAGACVDTATNAAHCGACGAACSPPQAQGLCVAGRCTVGMCSPGRVDCNGAASDGCEVDTRTDLRHCGRCNNLCTHGLNGAARCEEGMCRVSCAAGHHLCDGQCLPDDDPNSCGLRCTPCPAGPVGSRPVCVAGGCGFVCDTGYHRCGVVCSLNTSPASCGQSCTPCPTTANAESTCTEGRCGFRCREGFADCDNDPTNGCESDLRSNATCGSCQRRCPSGGNGTYACVAGACEVRCDAGFGDCDGNVSNGCEAQFASSPNHCGACGFACPTRRNAETTCAGAMCGFRCVAGFSDCNGVATDGCEHAGACTRTETLFSDGFEAGLVYWSPSANWRRYSFSSARWGAPNPHSGSWSYEADVYSCDREATTDVVRVLDLSSALSASVSFVEFVGSYYASSTSRSSDDYSVQASTDGGASWTTISTSALTVGNWRDRSISLSSMLGQRDVRLRLRVFNRCGDYDGALWFVDQIVVTATLRNY
jgi:hypothetical protein